jgi:hypothetical protein
MHKNAQTASFVGFCIYIVPSTPLSLEPFASIRNTLLYVFRALPTPSLQDCLILEI